jgi:CheY-like chemotaxis protein
MRIWIVEDNNADVYLLREALRSAGLDFAAETAMNGDQLVALLDAMKAGSIPPPDAVIVDFHMVKFNGIEIIGLIRSDAGLIKLGLAKLPIVVLTSSHNPADRARALEAGATAYFHKSLDLDDFLETGRAIVRLIQRPSAAGAAS